MAYYGGISDRSFTVELSDDGERWSDPGLAQYDQGEIFRWIWVAFRAKDHTGTCLAIGSAGVILAHVFENIGMTIGLMPVTGIPLPFISYGGSNLLTNMMFVGLILNVWMRRQQKR